MLKKTQGKLPSLALIKVDPLSGRAIAIDYFEDLRIGSDVERRRFLAFKSADRCYPEQRRRSFRRRMLTLRTLRRRGAFNNVEAEAFEYKKRGTHGAGQNSKT